jgi:hypothetical protein
MWRAGAVFLFGMVATLLTAAQTPISAPALAPPPAATTPLALAALDQLEAGLWQLDAVDRPSKQICVANGRELIQVAHDQSGCSRFVIANDPKVATVHYSCQGAGWGRTTIRVETARSAQVQTQGIVKNAPFDSTLTARRVGPCGK